MISGLKTRICISKHSKSELWELNQQTGRLQSKTLLHHTDLYINKMFTNKSYSQFSGGFSLFCFSNIVSSIIYLMHTHQSRIAYKKLILFTLFITPYGVQCMDTLGPITIHLSILCPTTPLPGYVGGNMRHLTSICHQILSLFPICGEFDCSPYDVKKCEH